MKATQDIIPPEQSIYQPQILFLQEQPRERYDPTAFMSRFANVRVPKSSLEALLDISLGLPDIVLADASYTLNFPETSGRNSVLAALESVAKEPQSKTRHSVIDVLRLAQRNGLTAILSGNENRLGAADTIPFDITGDELEREGILFVPRGCNTKHSSTFKEKIKKVVAGFSAPAGQSNTHSNKLYVIIGATNSGKTRTTQAIFSDPKFLNFKEIPKLTSRPRRASDRENKDTIFVPSSYIAELGDRVITYSLYGAQYGILKKMLRERLKGSNLLFGTASREVVSKLKRFLNGDVVPILLYPPQEFVRARVASSSEKKDRVDEVKRQYEVFEKMMSADEIRYVLRFNPNAVDCTGSIASAAVSFDEQVERVIKQYIFHRVRGIIGAENLVTTDFELAKKNPVQHNQVFYNEWVDCFTRTLFPGLSFSDLEKAALKGEKVELSFDSAALQDHAVISGVIPVDLHDKIQHHSVVAVKRAYGIGSIFLKPPSDVMRYTFGTVESVVLGLLLRNLKAFPYTLRDISSQPTTMSQFGYVQADEPVVRDLFQFRITDHYQKVGPNPADWPLRGVAIGFAPPDKELHPVSFDDYAALLALNYDSVAYKGSPGAKK